MKNNVLPSIVLTVFLSSCLSPPTTNKPYKPINKIPNAVVVGSVEATFTSEAVAGFRSDNRIISETAYIELLKVAREKYGDKIDIADITWIEVKNNMWRANVFLAAGKVITINT